MTTLSSHPAEPEAIAFLGHRAIAQGALPDVAAVLRTVEQTPTDPGILVFDYQTSSPIDLDLRGTEREVRERASDHPLRRTPPAPTAQSPRGPGRPRLGVLAKEVTLLPRHWSWLAGQPGGASATLRRLIDAERQRSEGPNRERKAREASYTFMSHLAGNLPGFEAATRALFAGNPDAFRAAIAPWPDDVVRHLQTLTEAAFGGSAVE